MTRSDDGLGETWPDRDAWDRWLVALEAAARRLQDERGVAEPWRVNAEWGVLWAEYGERLVRVAGEGAELAGPEELFGELDHWVAFERIAGPGRILDRDRQALAEWRERLPAVRQFWDDVARRVFRDVEASTNLHLPWKVVVHEDEPDWHGVLDTFISGSAGGLGGGVVGGIISSDMPMPQPGRRLLSFPQIWLETPHTGRGLPAMDDAAEAIGYLADLVQEDVIEEVHGAWPPCPGHSHPLEVGYADSGEPVWRCPTTRETTVAIGALGDQGGRDLIQP